MMQPMTDAADDDTTPTTSAAASASVSPTASKSVGRVVELQRVDTEADQLVHRRERLVERDQLAAATAALNAWEQERAGMNQRLEELGGVIERAETESAELAEHKQRLEAQMKTVIAPREAEALMHEIATIDERTDALDTDELEALEAQSDIDDRLTVHLESEESLRAATGAADEALARATGEIDTELAALEAARATARGELDASLLARYDRIRASSGVAVAKLVGHRCDGCHLDLSAAEVDDVKDEAAAADGLADCPQCGRMLVV